MAFRRYAKALVEKRGVEFEEWMDGFRDQHEGAVPKNHINKIAKTTLRKCDPKQFLLSHATIVASVDTYSPKNPKLGTQMNNGVQIDVRWPDFRVKPECHEIINNNGDAWERSLLLSTYRTFIGAHNYLEHIQLPELSKGFIVDAIARDLGKTCYIDILVATDRKHTALVSDIMSGKIDSMSMGCVSLFTICTKCGNVASDDAQLCPCIQYGGKGSKYIVDGAQHQISELIGHVSVPNSNHFIEASWVHQPAFTGAVRRNIINPNASQLSSKINKSKLIFDVKSTESDATGIKRAARLVLSQDDQEGQDEVETEIDLGTDDTDSGTESESESDDSSTETETETESESGESDTDEPDAPKKNKFDELLQKAQENMMEIFINNLSERLKPKSEDVGSVKPPPIDVGGSNDNLVSASRRQASFESSLKKFFPKNSNLTSWAIKTYKIVHIGGLKSIKANKLTSKDLIVLSWIEDRCRGLKYPSDLYKVSMEVGPISNFPSKRSFLAACRMRIDRDLTQSEQNFFEWKGRIASVTKF